MSPTFSLLRPRTEEHRLLARWLKEKGYITIHHHPGTAPYPESVRHCNGCGREALWLPEEAHPHSAGCLVRATEELLDAVELDKA